MQTEPQKALQRAQKEASAAAKKGNTALELALKEAKRKKKAAKEALKLAEKEAKNIYKGFEAALLKMGFSFEKEVRSHFKPIARGFKSDYIITHTFENGTKKCCAVEIDGGLYINGGHSRGEGRKNNMRKANYLACLGIPTLSFPADELKDDPQTGTLNTLGATKYANVVAFCFGLAEESETGGYFRELARSAKKKSTKKQTNCAG